MALVFLVTFILIILQIPYIITGLAFFIGVFINFFTLFQVFYISLMDYFIGKKMLCHSILA